MMSRAPRWPESPLDSKAVKPTQKPGAKQRASSAAPVFCAGKQASNSKTGDAHGRSRSLNRNSSAASGDGQQMTRQASRPAPAGARLCSSRSFSSLHTSSLSAAPFMRSSRSLSRLDHSSTTDDGVSNLEVRKGKRMEKKACGSGQLPSSGDDTRENNEETMKASGSSESASYLRSAEACAPNCRKIKKPTRDGVYTLCAMTSGMRRNWVQTVLKNVRPSLTAGIPSYPAEETIPLKTQQPDPHSAKDEEKEIPHKHGDSAVEPTQQRSEGEHISADGSSEMPLISLNESDAESCGHSTPDTQTSEMEALLKDQSEQPDVQMKEQVKTDNQSEEQQASVNIICDSVKESKKQLCEQQTVQLMKELEQTQKELSRLQQLSKSLQVELQQERKSHPQNDGSDQHQAQVLRLQRMNHDLRSELETLKREQEEAREAELRRRVDLLAQQAQLLVTGDATALAQVQLDKDRRKFFELQVEREHCIASLQSQLDSSEEQKKEAQLSSTKLQLELERFHGLQQENEDLHKQLEEVTRQLSRKEEAQAQKEASLEKHLTLLQASQDRERRCLATSLKQAEERAKDLQQRLDVAEEQLLNMKKSEAWASEIERAKEELEEELRCAVSDAKKLQEDRKQLQYLCEELQNQFSAADREVSRLESCLKTSETHYYTLESSYEKVCEELQGALKKVQQKESETQDMQEGYKRLLDRKEQELCEVLLKMEVLGNSLEETEVKLNELLSGSSCASSQLKDQSSEAARQKERQTDGSDVSEDPHRARITSCSSDSTYQDVASVGEDQERFMSVIQVLESKLFVTEEKLRDIMQRLEEHQSDVACQDPTLCSQLTQSRASTQHLSLLLHSQAKKNQRFAQETESCCRLLVGSFQAALNILQACRERLQLAPVDTVELEKQLATVAACLQQGERDAERHKQESRSISKGEDKILNDEPAATAESSPDVENVDRYLKNEIFVVEHMISVLHSEHAELLSLAPREDEEAVTKKFLSRIRQRINLKERAEYDNNGEVKGSVSRACADAELIYSALKLQQQLHHQRKSPAGTSPPELAPYEELDNASEGAAKKDEEVEADVTQEEMDREPDWLEGLLSRLKRRVKSLQQLAQEISDDRGVQRDMDNAGINAAAADLNWTVEEARLIYLSERLKLDLEQQSKEREVTIKDGQETLTPSLYGPGDDNSRLGEELEFPESGSQKIPKDMQEINIFHEKRLRKLQKEFEERVMELQQIHDEEIRHLQAARFEKQKEGGDAADLKQQPQASCNDEFGALEKMHMQLIQELQQQHEQEVAALLKQKDQQLQKETAATLTAIAAMRRAPELELGKNLHTQDAADVTQLYDGYGEEVQLLQRELELLSLQHSQKCQENAQLNQQLQDQQQALKQCQNQIQELKTKQRDEISEVQLPNGKQPHISPPTTEYEMEVILGAREAEMQFLRQEAHSLKEELKIARMDKIYAQNKLKALFTKSHDDPCRETNNLRDSFKFSTWSPTRGASGQTAEDTGAKTSSLKKSSLLRQFRGGRSKSLKEGLSTQERMKLLDSF